jgi:hypothetical protein
MMKIQLVVLYCCIGSALFASGKETHMFLKSSQSTVTQWNFFDINRIYSTIANDGPFADYRNIDSRGMKWPYKSGEEVIFTAGLWIIGKHRQSDSLRHALQFYNSEFQPGPIFGTVNTTSPDTTVAADPTDTKYRIYRITKGDNEFNNIDYAEWPGDLGAPYEDVNNNGTWDRGIDKPALIGDQMLWSVYNDLNMETRRYSKSINPMGVEVHALYYGFDSEGPLGDVMFMRWTIINKSDADYDSVIIGIFNDIDIGDGFDDVVASDPNRSLTYFYNGDSLDGNNNYGFRKRIPACGFFLLNTDDELSDRGVSNTDIPPISYTLVPIIKSGTSTLPILPYNFESRYSYEVFNIMNGLTNNGNNVINPFTHLPSKYIFDGDPVADSGWLYKHSYPIPYDNRSIVNTYPSTLARGDTHVVVGAFAIAQGSNQFNSITKLQRTVDAAKEFYRNKFKILYPTTTRVHHFKSGTKIIAAIQNNSTHPISITAQLHDASSDEVVLESIMNDNGLGEDSVSNDGKYTTSFHIPPYASPVYIRFIVKDSLGSTVQWENSSVPITSALLSADGVHVFKDNINNNGIAEKGELVQFKIRLFNPNPFPLYNIKMTPLLSIIRYYYSNYHYNFENIPPYGFVQSDSIPYFVQIPIDFPESYLEMPFKAEDESGNAWYVDYKIPVYSSFNAKQTKVSGKGIFEFEIAIAEPENIKDHWYSLSAREVVQTIGKFQYTPYIMIRDSTTGSILTQNLKPDTNAYSLYTQPSTDGFKVITRRFVSSPGFTITHSADSTRWNDVSVAFDTTLRYSTIHLGDLPSVSIMFSHRNGFLDSNQNGLRDSTELFLFDTTNQERTQKAYFYLHNTANHTYRLIGFEHIPFSVYDMDNQPPQKLTVVVVKRDTVPAIDFSTFTERMYIFSPQYDSLGKQFGDTGLAESFAMLKPLPYNYTLSIKSRNGNEYLTDSVSTFIKYSHPFSSRDVFVFNPTILASVNQLRDVPTVFTLEQNYPNPFNPNTTFRFLIPQQSKVILSIYNILGQRVATVVNEYKEPGEYSALWNGRNELGLPVASGMYIYHISAGNYTAAKKMMLLK